MDPITILSLIETCAALSVTAGKLAIGLKALADNYKSAGLTMRSLSNQCKLFACAVRAIQERMDDGLDRGRLDDAVWEQLGDSLECANDTIYELESELTNTSGGSINTFWKKVNVLWNQPRLKELEDCIHKQISGLSMILQILNLPTIRRQTQCLEDQTPVFQESRSSALSLRGPDVSTFPGSTDGESSMMTDISNLPKFDFDDMLLTSQVYLRNRNKAFAMHTDLLRKRVTIMANIRHPPMLQDSTTNALPHPNLDRLQELEIQLSNSLEAHEQTRQAFKLREEEGERVYREKLEMLESDYQSAVHYVKGTEKMLVRMKNELKKYKDKAAELSEALQEQKSLNESRTELSEGGSKVAIQV